MIRKDGGEGEERGLRNGAERGHLLFPFTSKCFSVIIIIINFKIFSLYQSIRDSSTIRAKMLTKFISISSYSPEVSAFGTQLYNLQSILTIPPKRTLPRYSVPICRLIIV